MGIKSKLNIESVGLLAASVFYAVTGIACFVVLSADFRLIHIGLIGILSLSAAYGIFKKRAWVLWFIVILFFMITAFSVSTLYYTMGSNVILDIVVAAYLVLTWVFTAYTANNRNKLEG